MFRECTGLRVIKYKNIEYTNSSTFITAFEEDGGTVASNAFYGSGF